MELILKAVILPVGRSKRYLVDDVAAVLCQDKRISMGEVKVWRITLL
jgi:hypothetical protein